MSRRHRPGRRPYRPGLRAPHAGVSGIPGADTYQPTPGTPPQAAQPGSSPPQSSPTQAGQVAALPTTTPGGPVEAGQRAQQQLVGDMLPHLDERTLTDLARLLGDSLNRPRPALARYDRLGLLIRLVLISQGIVPAIKHYDAARHAAGEQAGEQWPAASTLVALYGGWLQAVKAAIDHAYRGTAARVNGQYRGFHPPPQERRRRAANGKGSYTPSECVQAVLRCRDALGGEWPNAGEFDRFCSTERALAARHGLPDPRAPIRRAWQNACGSWNALILEAHRAAGLPEGSRHRIPSGPGATS